jgi:hypothetical protein
LHPGKKNGKVARYCVVRGSVQVGRRTNSCSRTFELDTAKPDTHFCSRKVRSLPKNKNNITDKDYSSRINIFGFLNARCIPEHEQNVGFLDQRLGLEWIRLNVEAFGGDVSRITLFRGSSGAVSVSYCDFAWPEDPIGSGLMVDSGTALLTNSDDGYLDPNTATLLSMQSN